MYPSLFVTTRRTALNLRIKIISDCPKEVKFYAYPEFRCSYSEVLGTAGAHTGLHGQLGVIRLLIGYDAAMRVVTEMQLVKTW